MSTGRQILAFSFCCAHSMQYENDKSDLRSFVANGHSCNVTVAGDLNADSRTAHTQDFRTADIQHRPTTEATKPVNSLNKRQVLPISKLTQQLLS